MEKKKERKQISWERLKATTNFYPTYVEGKRDKVTAVLSTRVTQFQTVIPRYKLSMSETRNEGTGPAFLENEYHTPCYRQEQDSSKEQKVEKPEGLNFKLPKHKRKKIRTDFWS